MDDLAIDKPLPLEPSTGADRAVKHGIGFFDIPREIRNLIYASTLDNHRYFVFHKQLPQPLRFRYLPWYHTLLVNHQFKRELLEAFSKTTMLVTSETPQNPMRLDYFPLGEHVTSVELHLIHLIIHCCDETCGDNDRCVDNAGLGKVTDLAINPCMEFPNTRSISLNIYIPRWVFWSIWERALLEFHTVCLTRLPDSCSLKDFNVYPVDRVWDDNLCSVDLSASTDRTLVLQWSHEAATLQVVKPTD